jgi:hypothetical protein
MASWGDVTWIHRSWPYPFWTELGGDFDPEPSAANIVGGVGLYTWTGPLLARDVQNWVDAPQFNAGWMLIGDESVPATVKRFDSTEIAPPAVPPLLLIDFVAADGGVLEEALGSED